MRLFAAGCRKLGLRNRQIKAGENQRRISASSTQRWRAAATLQWRLEGDANGMVQHPLTRAMAMLARQLLPGRNQLADQCVCEKVSSLSVAVSPQSFSIRRGVIEVELQ
jgi:hypothetical protein